MSSDVRPEKIPRRIDTDENPPEEPDAERGERRETGKAIARGGKSEGDVPGATDQDEKDDTNP